MRLKLIFLLACFISVFTLGYGQVVPSERDNIPAEPPMEQRRNERLKTSPPVPPQPKHKPLLKFQENGLFGLKLGDSVITPPVYEYIDYTTDWPGKYVSIIKKGKYGLLKRNGQELIPCLYDASLRKIDFSSEKLFVVKLNDKYGVVNSANKILIPVEFDEIVEDIQGLLAEKNKLYGFYNEQAKMVFPTVYTYISRLHRYLPYFVLQKDKLHGIATLEGKMLHEANLTEIKPVADSWFNTVGTVGFGKYYTVNTPHIMVKTKAGKAGVLNAKTGTLLIPEQYAGIYQQLALPDETVFIAKRGNKFGVINTRNKELVKFTYDSLAINHLN